MLTISKEQMESLSALTRRRYVEKTVPSLRKLFPEQTEKQSDEELRAAVEQGVDRAGKYKITGGREVTLFINFMFGIGKDFDSQAANEWMKKLLEHTDLEQNEKMDTICKRVQARNAANKNQT